MKSSLRLSAAAFPLLGLLALACGDSPSNEAPFQTDRDEDGWPSELDCDDEDPTVFPSADDVSGDGIDQDCSGSDGSGRGEGGAPNETGGAPSLGGECSDCASGGSATGGESTGGSAPTADLDFDGYSVAAGDCDDQNPSVYPDRMEYPFDGIDQNCDKSDLPSYLLHSSWLPEAAKVAHAPALATATNSEGEPVMLAVWADSRVQPRQDLYGQLLAEDGSPIGAPIPIDNIDNAAKNEVVVLSKGDQFLVAWSTDFAIHVRFVSRDGSLNVDEDIFDEPALIYADAPANLPALAFDGTNWIMAWYAAAADGIKVRTMDTEGSRSVDVYTLDTGPVSDIRLAPRASGGFLATWTGPMASDHAEGLPDPARGLSAQLLATTGEPTGSPFDLVQSAQQGRILRKAGGYDLLYRMTSTAGRIEATELNASGAPSGLTKILSTEVASQLDLRAVRVEQSFSWLQHHESLTLNPYAEIPEDSIWTAWVDQRFQPTHSLGAIYGNALVGEHSLFPNAAPLLVSSSVSLGDIALVGETGWMSLKSDTFVGLVQLGGDAP